MIPTIIPVYIRKRGEQFELSSPRIRVDREAAHRMRLSSKHGTVRIEFGPRGNPFESESDRIEIDDHNLDFGPVRRGVPDGMYEFMAYLSSARKEIARLAGAFVIQAQPLGECIDVTITVDGETVTVSPDPVEINRIMEEQVCWKCVTHDFEIVFDGPKGSPFGDPTAPSARFLGTRGTPKSSGVCQQGAPPGNYKYTVHVVRPNESSLILDPIVEVEDDGGDV